MQIQTHELTWDGLRIKQVFVQCINMGGILSSSARPSSDTEIEIINNNSYSTTLDHDKIQYIVLTLVIICFVFRFLYNKYKKHRDHQYTINAQFIKMRDKLNLIPTPGPVQERNKTYSSSIV